MPKLEAIVALPFGVGVKAVGEQFDATPQEANLLIALKRAKLVKAEPEPKAEKVEKVVKAADEPEKAEKPAKGKYATRRLKAKD